jgi:hypothetical protein
LFTEEVTWRLRGLDLTGRDAILKALYAGSGSGDDTIRHIVNNIIINVIDGDHAELRTYTTIYYSKEGNSEDMGKPVHLAGPQEPNDTYAKLRRVGDSWKIAVREGACMSSSVRIKQQQKTANRYMDRATELSISGCQKVLRRSRSARERR